MESSNYIRIDSNKWVDLYAASGIAVGTALVIQNIGSEDARLVEGNTTPTIQNGYNMIGPQSYRVNQSNSVGAWAWSKTGTTLQVETAGRFTPNGDLLSSGKSYLEKVAANEVSGSRVINLTAVNFDVDVASIEDIWQVGGKLVYATSGEQYNIVSTSSDDAIAGIGAQVLNVRYLDVNYTEQSELVNLSGTTPVLTAATDIFRLIEARVVQGSTNIGNISIDAVGSGLPRGLINVFDGRTLNGFYTVPMGKKASLLYGYSTIQKNKDAVIFLQNTNGDDGVFTLSLPINLYENSFSLTPATPLGVFPEMTEVQAEASTQNNNTRVSIFVQILEEDA